MQKKSVAKNYIFNLTYQIFAIIISLITTPYLARVLGAEKTGIYSYTMSITAYFILFGSMGIAMYGQREIAYSQNDIKKRSKIFFELLSIKMIAAIISLVVFYFTFCLEGQYSIYYKIFAIQIFSNTIDIAWFYYGLENFNTIAIKNTIIKIIEISCIFLFVKSPNDLKIYVIIYVLSTLLGNISLFFGLKKYLTKFHPKELDLKSHVSSILSLFIPQIAMQIYMILDKTMLGNILNDMAEVGYYEQSQKIIKIVLTLVTAFTGVMTSKMSTLFSHGNNADVEKNLKISFNFVWFLAFPIMIGLIVISDKFVPIFYGDGYDKVKMLLIIFSPMIIATGISNIIGMLYLIPSRKQKLLTISVSIGAFINMGLNFILIPHLQSTGCAIASVFAEFCVSIIQIYFINKDIKILKMFKIATRYFISSIIMGIIVFIMTLYLNASFFNTFLEIIVGVIVYFGILLIINDEFMSQIINEIKKYLMRIMGRHRS